MNPFENQNSFENQEKKLEECKKKYIEAVNKFQNLDELHKKNLVKWAIEYTMAQEIQNYIKR